MATRPPVLLVAKVKGYSWWPAREEDPVKHGITEKKVRWICAHAHSRTPIIIHTLALRSAGHYALPRAIEPVENGAACSAKTFSRHTAIF
jgi:hypothetical protein